MLGTLRLFTFIVQLSINIAFAVHALLGCCAHHCHGDALGISMQMAECHQNDHGCHCAHDRLSGTNNEQVESQSDSLEADDCDSFDTQHPGHGHPCETPPCSYVSTVNSTSLISLAVLPAISSNPAKLNQPIVDCRYPAGWLAHTLRHAWATPLDQCARSHSWQI